LDGYDTMIKLEGSLEETTLGEKVGIAALKEFSPPGTTCWLYGFYIFRQASSFFSSRPIKHGN
jgi:hypothetical protein